jgi:hypothetical protein
LPPGKSGVEDSGNCLVVLFGWLLVHGEDEIRDVEDVVGSISLPVTVGSFLEEFSEAFLLPFLCPAHADGI